MKIFIDGEEREATPEEATEILAAQAAAFQATEGPLTQPLDRLRFWLAAASAHISKWDIRDRIAAMPDQTFEEKKDKSEAIAWFEEAKQYRRNDPLLVRFATEEGISEQELDALWIWTVQSAPPVPGQPA